MKLGTLDAGVENIFKQLLGNLTSSFMTEGAKLEKLDEFERAIKTNFLNKAKARTSQNLTQQQGGQGSAFRQNFATGGR